MKFYTTLVLLLLTQLIMQAQQQTYWWNDRVFYEIFVRSFYDQDGNGIGDFKGLTSKLDYLNDGNPATTNDLGITAIWLMPIMQSPSYHGYDVIDYKKVEQDYGTNADFVAFLDSAHARGIKVIIDFVMNHTSNQHPWFVNSRSGTGAEYRNWYIWKTSNPGNLGPWGEQVWYSYGGYYYYSVFTSSMPDLNYFNPAVKTEMFNTTKYWLDTLKVDGFRLDAVRYICEDGDTLADSRSTLSFLRDFRNMYKSVMPDAMAVGEAWTTTSQVIPYVDGTGIDMCFEFDTAGDIISCINSGNPSTLISQMNNIVTKKYPFLQYATFLSNHDQQRVYSQLGSSIPKSKLAAAIMLTMPGVPFIYYGEELAMNSATDDPSKRTPMQWTAGTNAGFTSGSPWHSLNSGYTTNNVQTLGSDSTSILNFYKKLIRFRNNSNALRKGSYVQLSSSSSSVYMFGRYYSPDNEIIIPVHNFTSGAISIYTISASGTLFTPGTYKITDLLTGQAAGQLKVSANGDIFSLPSLTLSAYTSAVFKAELVSGIAETTTAPARAFRLEQNYPNPFNPVTKINFELKRGAQVLLRVFDMMGREVAVVVNEYKTPGVYSVQFDGRNLPSGVYYYQLQSESMSETRKCMLLK